jgi:PIN domain nuclease of toxin-antitoxin system
MPFKEVFNQVNENGFEILPITFEHTELLSRLEFHHRDPFDRLIAAQAGCERMAVISKDRAFDHYRVERIW